MYTQVHAGWREDREKKREGVERRIERKAERKVERRIDRRALLSTIAGYKTKNEERMVE